MTPLTDRTLWISLCSTAQTTLIAFLKHPDHRDRSILFFGNPRGLKMRHHCLLDGHGPDATSSIHDNSVPFLNVGNCLFSNDEILCGYEHIVSSGTDHFTAWVKVSPHEVLVQHMVDVQKATADFREASERRPATSSQTNRVNKHFTCAEEAQHLQPEPWAPTWKRRRLRKADCGGMAYHYIAGGVCFCRSGHSYRSIPRDPLRRLRDSLQ